MPQAGCIFCNPTGETVLWSDAHCRVLHVSDAKFPGFCRVIWNAHVTEFTDLDEAARAHVMKVVALVEQALRKLLAPDKINLASLGNQTPHLHWHIIPRYRDDAHFPDPIWAAVKRPGVVRPLPSDFASSVRKTLETALR
ncbi:MAG TPA: HIT family protein [Casimicrobiaceae bacterium]|nr:HIT family protein [Casimicrobiaceae bacterium]